MKTIIDLIDLKRIALLLLPMVLCLHAAAQGTSFSCQGSLSENNQPATGLYEFRFNLYNAEVGGSQVGAILTKAPVAVANGVFATTLDFGAETTGAAPFRWLDGGAISPGKCVGGKPGIQTNALPVILSRLVPPFFCNQGRETFL